MRGMAARDTGMPTGCRGIAVADREQPVSDGMPAPGMTPLAPPVPQPLGHPPECAQDRPRQHCGCDSNAERQREYRERGFDPPAAQRQRDVAGLIGNPRRARRRQRDQHQKQNDPIHRIPIAAVGRAPPSHQLQIDGTRRAPHRAHRLSRSMIGLQRDRQAPTSSARAAPPRHRCVAPLP